MELEKNKVKAIRQTMQGFLEARLADKLEKEKDEEKREKLTQDYELDRWLETKSKAASQIQFATHIPKALHTAAKASALMVDSEKLPGAQLGKEWIGSHLLGESAAKDVVGNAAQLDIVKFLQSSVKDDLTLSELFLKQDPHFIAALATDSETAQERFTGFWAMVEPSASPVAHSLLKQVYFPTAQDGYILGGILYPSSLVDRIKADIFDDRFGEEAKEAHEKRKKGESHSHGFRDYPDLLVNALGGSKPQNVSLLNSMRHGEAWLLPSLPPNVKQETIRLPRQTSIFEDIIWTSRDVKDALNELLRFLLGVDYNNANIRAGRERRVERLIDSIMVYANSLAEQGADWTTTKHSRLSKNERWWLDVGYRDNAEPESWEEKISEKFALWLGKEFQKKKVSLDVETNAYFRKVFLDELNWIGPLGTETP